MATELPGKCFLCGETLRYGKNNKLAEEQGLPVGANTNDPNAKSEAHYGHLGGARPRPEFKNLSDEAWVEMEVEDRQGSRVLCFECHEVILHNPVLSESQLDRLAALFRGKLFEERVVILNRIIEHGLVGESWRPR